MTNLFISLAISLTALITGGDEAELVFAGDAMQHTAQNTAAKQSDGTYSFDECFASIAPYVQAADYAVVNLETPLGGAPYSGYPMFCAPDSYSMALKNAGFDLMLTANNHALDKRDKGAKRTLDVLDEQGLAHVGTYRNKADREKSLPLIKDINGFKVGVVFAETHQSELGNRLSEMHPELDLIAMVNLDTMHVGYRTVRDDINTGRDFATMYKNGGGHPKASGSLIEDNVKDEVIKLVFEGDKYDIM